MVKNASDSESTVQRNDAEHRYEVWVGGRMAGVATYRETDERVTFIHTIVDDAFEGQGLGSRLAAFAVGDTVERGKRIMPRCPFINAWLRRHHDFDKFIDWPAPVSP